MTTDPAELPPATIVSTCAGSTCPKCGIPLIRVSHRVDGSDVWKAADYCMECGWLASGAVRPADSIPVVPHVTVEPNQPCAGARERYMRLSIETQMATQSAYLADALELCDTPDSRTYARLSRDARKRLRMIQIDLLKWQMEILWLREELASAKAMLDDMGSRYGYWQAFKEWWNGK